MNFLLRLANFIDLLNERIGKAVSWLTTLLVVVVIVDVLMRYALKQSKNYITELEWHLFALIFLLGAAYTLKHDKHVRVDLFYDKFSKRDKAMVNFWGTLIFLIPWCLLILYASYGYAWESWFINERSPNPDGLPARYLIKFALVFGIGLLLLQAISTLIRSYHILQGAESDSEESLQS